MAKMLVDGETRQIMPRDTHGWTKQRIRVKAYRLDCDTPFVILEVKGREGNWQELHFTDYEAADIVKMFNKALEVLPTSK